MLYTYLQYLLQQGNVIYISSIFITRFYKCENNCSFLMGFFQIKRSTIRKGMVMVSPKIEPKACWEFESEVLVLHHPTTISVRYQAMGKCYIRSFIFDLVFLLHCIFSLIQ